MADMLSFAEGARELRETVTLRPDGESGSFTELELHLEEGDALTYRWKAGAELAFNIHAHEEKRVDFFEEAEDTARDGVFQAPRGGHFYLMWTNRNPEPVDVEIQAARQG